MDDFQITIAEQLVTEKVEKYNYIHKYLDAFVLLFCVVHLNNPVLFLTFSFLIFWYCGRNRDINVSALTNFDELSNIRFHSIMTTVGKKEVNVKCNK